MRYTANGVPYDICPICHEMILPKMFGGSSHINSHAVSEANRYFKLGFTIQQVNAQLLSEGITLFPNIPPQMKNVTHKSKIVYDNVEYKMVGFDHYEAIRLQPVTSRHIKSIKLWDRRFLALAKITDQ